MAGKTKIKTSDMIFIAIFLAFFIVLAVTPALAAGVDDALEGLNTTASQAYDGQAGGAPKSVITSIPEAIGRIIGALLAFIGVLFFVLMIYGGFLWMTARGNETQTGKARDLIAAAVIGLIIVLSAYAITSYLGSTLIGG
jgi:uncharacterized BrkB/YihY/UPF0761 family membrane protein